MFTFILAYLKVIRQYLTISAVHSDIVKCFIFNSNEFLRDDNISTLLHSNAAIPGKGLWRMYVFENHQIVWEFTFVHPARHVTALLHHFPPLNLFFNQNFLTSSLKSFSSPEITEPSMSCFERTFYLVSLFSCLLAFKVHRHLDLNLENYTYNKI